ncbi:MAG: glycosyltransferase family 39 protein [Planctomycetaceae bacterium]
MHRDETPTRTPTDFQRVRRDVLCCMSVALVLRLLTCWWYTPHLTEDLDAYAGNAQSLADGRGFSSPGSTVPTAYRPPLFPLLLTALMAFTPVTWSVAILQIVMGVAAVAMTWRLGRELRLERYALLAALLVSVDPILLYFGTYPMTEVCCAFFTTAWCWFVVRATRGSERTTASSVAWTNFGGGVVFGLAALCRPTLWAAGGLYGCYLIASLLIARRRHAPIRLSGLIAHLVGAVLIVSPWVIRNQMVFGTPILTTTHGGYTLLLGNNPTFYEEVVDRPWGTVWGGGSLSAWQRSLEMQMRQGNVDGEIERDRWMNRRAKEFIREHPATFLKACVKRFFWFWNPVPLETNESPFSQVARWGVGLYYGAVTLLMIVGGGLLVARYKPIIGSDAVDRRNAMDWAVVVMTVLGFAGTHLIYWSNMRMRGPIVPLISLLAAVGVQRLAARRSKKDVAAGETP